MDMSYSLNSQKAQQGVHVTVVACYSLKGRKLPNTHTLYRVCVLLKRPVTPLHERCSKQTNTATIGVLQLLLGVQLVPCAHPANFCFCDGHCSLLST